MSADRSPREGGQVRNECQVTATADHLPDAVDEGEVSKEQVDLVLAMTGPSSGVEGRDGLVVHRACPVLVFGGGEIGEVAEALSEELSRARRRDDGPVDIEERYAAWHDSQRRQSIRGLLPGLADAPLAGSSGGEGRRWSTSLRGRRCRPADLGCGWETTRSSQKEAAGAMTSTSDFTWVDLQFARTRLSAAAP